MQFREPVENSRKTKTQYRDALDRLIACREEMLADKRRAACADIFANGEAHRRKFREMLGWPLTEEEPKPVPDAQMEKLGEEGDYAIYRMQIRVMEDLALAGIFLQYLPEANRPVVVSQHGGLGTPEFISGFYNGDTANYNHMTDRLLPHRVHVFCPQLLLWNTETYGEAYDRKTVDARLKRVGSSITAVDVYAIMRALDWFADRYPASPFGMIGLSYGGFYTLFTAAADTRILSAVSCSFFSRRDAYPWTDWTWTNAAALYDDAEIACLAYPRRMCVEMGDHDNLFAIEHTRAEAERVQQYIRDAGVNGDWFDCVIFEGTHELCLEDAPILRMMEDLERGMQ